MTLRLHERSSESQFYLWGSTQPHEAVSKQRLSTSLQVADMPLALFNATCRLEGDFYFLRLLLPNSVQMGGLEKSSFQTIFWGVLIFSVGNALVA